MKTTKLEKKTVGLQKLHLSKETILGYGQSQTAVDTNLQFTCVAAACHGATLQN